MKVILLQDIYKHGVTGEVVTVADGFARNYLIPRGMAVQATKSNVKRHRHLAERVEARRAQYENMLNDLARQIDGTELIFGRRAASTGKLFGSVTTQEIAEALNEATGVDINRRRISQQGLREIGEHDVPVRLGSDESPVLKVIIVREDEMQEFLAAREAAARGEVPGEGDEATEGDTEDVKAEVSDMATEVIPRSAVQAMIDEVDAEQQDANDEADNA